MSKSGTKERVKPNGKFTLEYVASVFAEHGCELLATEYVNARTKLQYRCSCQNISEICLYSLKNGNKCKKCGTKRGADKQRGTIRLNIATPQRLNHDFVANYFAEHECKLLSKYINTKQKLEFICKCGKKSCRRFPDFKVSHRCDDCGLKARSGENHYEWRSDKDQQVLEFQFRQCCCKMLQRVLKYTGRIKETRTEKMLGYSCIELKNHITSHPNWQNVKDGDWAVDHCFPVKAFISDYGIDDIKLVNCLENLQPLSSSENSAKNDHYDPAEFEKWLTSKDIQFESKL